MTFPMLLLSLFNCLTMNAVFSKYSSLWCKLCAVQTCPATTMYDYNVNECRYTYGVRRINKVMLLYLFALFLCNFWTVYKSKSVLLQYSTALETHKTGNCFFSSFFLHTSTPSKTNTINPHTHTHARIHSFAFNRSPGQLLAH